MPRADQEARADPAARVAHRDPVGRVEQLVDRDAVDRVDLGRVDHADRALLGPPAEHRASPRSCSAAATARAARRRPRRRRHADPSPPRPRAAPPRAGSHPGRSSPGEGDLSRVRAHVVGTLGQQQVAPRSRRAAARRPAAAWRRRVATNLVRSSAVIAAAAARATGSSQAGITRATPRYFRAAAATSCLGDHRAGLDVRRSSRRHRGTTVEREARGCGAAGWLVAGSPPGRPASG